MSDPANETESKSPVSDSPSQTTDPAPVDSISAPASEPAALRTADEPAPLPDSPPPLPIAATPEPPVLPQAPLIPSPQAPASASNENVPVWMWASLAASGPLLLFLSIVVAGHGARAHELSYRVGNVVGGVLFWPAIILGLFSLGRRFRTPRRRAIILLSVWGVCIMGQLGNIHLHLRRKPPTLAGPNRPGEITWQNQNLAPSPSIPAKVEPAPAPSARAQRDPSNSEFNFSPGSDKRLIKLIETAQQVRYRTIVGAYARACERRPNDAVLALERVRFIERFAFSEDITFEGAEQDHEAAVEYLKSRFPDAPGTVLYDLESSYGPEFATKAAAHAARAAKWPRPERAKFFLLRGEREENETRQRIFARMSFDDEPSVRAALLLFDTATTREQRAESLPIAAHPILGSAEPWEKVRVMNFLFTANQNARAFALYREIKAAAPAIVQSADTAQRLAGAGHLEAARAILAAMPVNQWNVERVQRDRLRFELDYGSAESAGAAYVALRDTGIGADPFLRDRFRLFLIHPALGWQARDLFGGVLLLLLFAGLALAPALVLVPVHYWSLLRARRGKPGSWPDSKWGLREVWLAAAALMCADIACLWFFHPEELHSWWSDAPIAHAQAGLSDAALLSQQGLAWAAMAIIAGIALWRARAWRVLGTGSWSLGRTVGLCLASTVLLRIVILGYTAIWPEAIEGELASLSPATKQLCLVLLKHSGPAGLILSLAVLVPLLEELLFRGVLLQGLAKHIPFGWANAVQSLLFALVHENLRLLPFFVAFGLICGFLTRRSGGLLPAIAVHGCNNLLVCFVVMIVHARPLG